MYPIHNLVFRSSRTHFHIFPFLCIYSFMLILHYFNGKKAPMETMNTDQKMLESDAELTRKQNQRVFLRQRFLQFLRKTALLSEGVPVKIVLHEGKGCST